MANHNPSDPSRNRDEGQRQQHDRQQNDRQENDRQQNERGRDRGNDGPGGRQSNRDDEDNTGNRR